jgi:hypothetical protein
MYDLTPRHPTRRVFQRRGQVLNQYSELVSYKDLTLSKDKPMIRLSIDSGPPLIALPSSYKLLLNQKLRLTFALKQPLFKGARLRVFKGARLRKVGAEGTACGTARLFWFASA